MELTAFDELALWVKENIFDEPEPSPEVETLEVEEEPDTNTLSENARLYHWCPRRKRLVQSN